MLRSFRVSPSEMLDVIKPSVNPITGETSRAIRYYNGTKLSDNIVIIFAQDELLIAHVTAEGRDEINAMEAVQHPDSDTV